MDLPTFVIEMTRSLSWPVVIVVAVLALRGSLGKLLPGMTSAKAEVAGQRLELTFADRAQVEELAGAQIAPEESSQPALPGQREQEPPISAEDLSTITLASELTRGVLVMDGGRVIFEDGTQVTLPVPPGSLVPRTADLVRQCCDTGTPTLGRSRWRLSSASSRMPTLAGIVCESREERPTALRLFTQSGAPQLRRCRW
jgi:hypothetical protein